MTKSTYTKFISGFKVLKDFTLMGTCNLNDRFPRPKKKLENPFKYKQFCIKAGQEIVYKNDVTISTENGKPIMYFFYWKGDYRVAVAADCLEIIEFPACLIAINSYLNRAEIGIIPDRLRGTELANKKYYQDCEAYSIGNKHVQYKYNNS